MYTPFVLRRRHIPLLLTGVRLGLGPVMLWNAWGLGSGIVFLFSLTGGFLSDIFDGIVARRLGVATPRLRRFDSLTDVVFYASGLLCIWIVHPEIVRGHMGAIETLASLETLGQLISIVRFRKIAAVHAYSAKVWGIFLFLAMCAVLGFGADGILFEMMLVVGLVAYAEWLGILILSDEAVVDVRSVLAVWRDRKRRPLAGAAKQERSNRMISFGSGC
jgi:phosphatidylglycerophosphate synthase